MAVTMVYLTTSLSRWRLASRAHGDDKAANPKAIIAVECAAELSNAAILAAECADELSNWSTGSRASIRALICL